MQLSTRRMSPPAAAKRWALGWRSPPGAGSAPAAELAECAGWRSPPGWNGLETGHQHRSPNFGLRSAVRGAVFCPASMCPIFSPPAKCTSTHRFPDFLFLAYTLRPSRSRMCTLRPARPQHRHSGSPSPPAANPRPGPARKMYASDIFSPNLCQGRTLHEICGPKCTFCGPPEPARHTQPPRYPAPANTVRVNPIPQIARSKGGLYARY